MLKDLLCSGFPMVVGGLNRRQRPRIGTLSVFVAQLETIGFVQELCHYTRRAILSGKDAFTYVMESKCDLLTDTPLTMVMSRLDSPIYFNALLIYNGLKLELRHTTSIHF